MSLTDKTVSELLAAFRSSEPTPGGGSASALAGAVGASLVAMVAALPKPQATTDGDVRALQDAGRRCSTLAIELEALIDHDTSAYNMVVDSYRMPKATEDERTARSAAIQSALRAATDAPLDVMRRCVEAARLAETARRLGNPNAASDVTVAIYMLQAGLSGAAANVEINLGSVKDLDYVARVRDEARALANPE